MSEDFLSQEEVDALLKGVSDDTDGSKPAESTPAPASSGVRPYELGQQERNVPSRMPALELINDRFARSLRVGLSNYIGRSCEISVAPIKVQKYSEFIRNLTVPTSLNLIQAKPLRGTGLLVLDPNLLFMVIDNMFGGDGRFHTRVEARDFTATEQRIISGLLKVVFAEYEKAWQPTYPVAFDHIRSETNTQFANITTPSEIVISITFSIELSGSTSEMHLCLPYAMIDPIQDVLNGSMPSTDQASTDKRWIKTLTRQLQTAEIELNASLGHATVTLGDIVKMKTGDIIPIEIPDQLTVEVEQVPVLKCRYGVRNGQYALKVERFTANDETAGN